MGIQKLCRFSFLLQRDKIILIVLTAAFSLIIEYDNPDTCINTACSQTLMVLVLQGIKIKMLKIVLLVSLDLKDIDYYLEKVVFSD